MKKNKMSLTTELDLTREGTAEMTRWFILIALHQSFGIGAARLNKILARAEKLGQESLDVAMTVYDRGMPSTDRSLALRRSWMPRNVDPDFRVPVLRSPRTRREEQLRMAGDVAAGMVWTLCAKACMDELGFSTERLLRLKEEALANYRQVNEEGHADGLDVAMEHLRRCAQAALKEDIVVENQPDEDRVRQSERDYEEQKRAFLKRAVMQQLGRKAGKGGLRVLSEKTTKYFTSPELMPVSQKAFSGWVGLDGYSYGNLMRVCKNPAQCGYLAMQDEYGWDGWLGVYFANLPNEKTTILMGMQKVDAGTFSMTRKIRNRIVSKL